MLSFFKEKGILFIDERCSWNKRQKKTLLAYKTNNIVFKTMISSDFFHKLFKNKNNDENIFNVHFSSPS
jgi:hypothetical protein